MTRNNYISPIGDDWEDLRNELLSPEERAETDLKIALLDEIINARKDMGLSQRKLEAVSGIKQPVIARLEKGHTDPNLSTMMKLLAPLGKTLAVVSVDEVQGIVN